jgi:hypothetical protein
MAYQTAPVRALTTNGFKVDLPEKVDVLVRDFPTAAEVKVERARLADYWFLHWTGGKLYHLRLQAGGPNVDAEPQTVEPDKHPWLFRARVDDAIGAALGKYTPVRVRPFTFLALKAELIEEAAKAARLPAAMLAQGANQSSW